MVSVPAGGGGITAVQITAGTTNTNISNFSFSDGSNVSFGINGSTITASVASSLTNIKVSAGANSANLSAVTFSNSNGVSFGLNGSTITASISNATMSYLEFRPIGATSSNDIPNGNIFFRYLQVEEYISLSEVDVPVMFSISSAANANTAAIAITSAAVIHSINGSTLSPIVGFASTTTLSYASNSANYSSLFGGRYYTFPIASQTFQRSLITGNSGSNAYRGNFYAILRNV
jgi:hypothetical protein